MNPELALVWFKKDLRCEDHEALYRAIETGKAVVACFIWEPEWFEDEDFDLRHARFAAQGLDELRGELLKWRIPLLEFSDKASNAFDRLRTTLGNFDVFSCEEVGNARSFARDRKLKAQLRTWGIPWFEFARPGIRRGLKNRAFWDERWKLEMNAPLFRLVVAAPDSSFEYARRMDSSVRRPEFRDSTASSISSEFQIGGRSMGLSRLDRFLHIDSARYRFQISKPEGSRTHCSRLSPYLAWGMLSQREVFQAALKQIEIGVHRAHLRSFASRLHWNSHFVQKFESESRMEFEDVNKGFSALERIFDREKFEAFALGQTGYPLVDACVRCLAATGYINFRMRAMLVSFATHSLRLPWQPISRLMARWFLDYEPGIHYPQIQMQSGTTGINALRVYNPVKQSIEHDPEARFVKQWVPELSDLPSGLALQPWKTQAMEELFYGFVRGRDYPDPIVDERAGIRFAREWHELRKSGDVRRENQRIKAVHTTADRSVKRRSDQILGSSTSTNACAPNALISPN